MFRFPLHQTGVETSFPLTPNGSLFTRGIPIEYGPFAGVKVNIFRELRGPIKCRRADVGRFAGALTVDRQYMLTPNGKFAQNGLQREYIHTSISLFNTIEAAAKAVENAWEVHGRGLPREHLHIIITSAIK